MKKLYTPEEIMEMLALPCCHTTGMHDPQHFAQKKYVCDSQAREALENLCKAIGINPVTKCGEDCYWCNRAEKKYTAEQHKGEGLALIWPNEEVVKRMENEDYHAKPTAELAEMVATVLKRQPKYAGINKDFQREWKKYMVADRKSHDRFGRTSEGSKVTNPLSDFRFRVSGKKSETYQPYELERLVTFALRHSKRIYGL